MAPRTSKKEPLGFEQALERLEEIKTAMDSPDTGLEQMIALYEEGLTLINQSRRILANAELRIQTLEAAGQQALASDAAASPAPSPEPPHEDDEFTLL